MSVQTNARNAEARSNTVIKTLSAILRNFQMCFPTLLVHGFSVPVKVSWLAVFWRTPPLFLVGSGGFFKVTSWFETSCWLWSLWFDTGLELVLWLGTGSCWDPLMAWSWMPGGWIWVSSLCISVLSHSSTLALKLLYINHNQITYKGPSHAVFQMSGFRKNRDFAHFYGFQGAFGDFRCPRTPEIGNDVKLGQTKLGTSY